MTLRKRFRAFTTIRARLTLWYTAILAAALAVFVAVSYLALSHAIRQHADQTLADACRDAAATLQAEAADPAEGGDLRRAAVESLREFQLADHTFYVFDDQDNLVTSTSLARGRPPSNSKPSADELRSALLAGERPATLVLHTLYDRHGEEAYRACAVRGTTSQQAYAVVGVQSLTEQEGLLEHTGQGFALAVALALALAALGGYLLARHSLRPVVDITSRAQKISAENLHERVPVERADELGYLATVFNDLLQRLEKEFDQQRQFMADTSHELRTPLAIIQGEADVALSRVRQPEEYREALRVIQAESLRFGALVDDLLILARVAAGQQVIARSSLYLEEVLAECSRRIDVLARQRRVQIVSQVEEEMPLQADARLLQRLFLNLLDNAIRFTPPGGKVSVRAAAGDADYRVHITDTGPGIPPESQEHIFDRFFRTDPSRQRPEEAGGSGLGLAIVRCIAGQHGGSVELVRSGSDGSEFLVRLPRVLL